MTHCNTRISCGTAERPSVLQHVVVDVLYAQARGPANDIDGIEQFLEVNQFGIPRKLLLLDDLLEGGGRGAVAAAGVEVDQRDACHRLRIVAHLRGHGDRGAKNWA